MKINKNNKMLWMIKATYGNYNNPKTVCEFMWKAIVSIFTMVLIYPFTIYMTIISIIDKNIRENPNKRSVPPLPFIFFIVFSLILIVVSVAQQGNDKLIYFFNDILWLFPLLTIINAIIIASIIGITYVCYKLFCLIYKFITYLNTSKFHTNLTKYEIIEKKQKHKRKERFKIISQWIKNIKEKTCTIIEYTNDK